MLKGLYTLFRVYIGNLTLYYANRLFKLLFMTKKSFFCKGIDKN